MDAGRHMDTRKHLIILNGEIKTDKIKSCRYNPDTRRMEVEFTSGGKYPYAYSNVKWFKEPEVLNPDLYRICTEGRELFNIEAIYVFRDKKENSEEAYWHICYNNGIEKDYLQSKLDIVESCLSNRRAGCVFAYLRQIAGLNDLKNADTGEKLLAKKFAKISFVGNDTALAKYLDPSSPQRDKHVRECIPVFPFGCNNSQYQAVKRAMENQISVIQGPPGTGKTQTILNIIANILLQGKTVQIVSNNNSATENVYEKLSSAKYNLGFIVAALGSAKNKEAFVERQDGRYPDFTSWKLTEDPEGLQQSISEKSALLGKVFDRQERLAHLKQEQAQLATESAYFERYVRENDMETAGIKSLRKLLAKSWMEIWQECQMISEERDRIGILFQIKSFIKYGIADRNFYKQDMIKMITALQTMYYHTKLVELAQEITVIEEYLDSVDQGVLQDLCDQSMVLLRGRLAEKYGDQKERRIFSEDDLWKNPYDVLEEYPVVLSTTFSSGNSLGAKVMYDYLIMDEASQVDIATGALALSCARNVVIVGDTKQLPNVVTEDVMARAKAVFDSYDISEGYQYTKSFLQSVLDVIPDVTQTMLREHYRCHPRIIDFCNQKFYRGELIIMTEDKGEEDVLSVVKTVPGNHVRNHYSQRQIDVIKNEIIPQYVVSQQETGIIAPYRNHVEALQREIEGIDAATVHKFQGKEKDTIIISTVDDEISDFADDPYLINVAVSRAKKKLILVVTGNEQVKERNITDLIDYIAYHNFTVTDSKIYSVFDYLYRQYAEERKAYLHKRRKISEYDSENLMYALIEDVLSEDQYSSLEVLDHYPLYMLIKDAALLSEPECRYAMNRAAHVDFLLYNRISKKPVLAVEVDGYEYHKNDTVQAGRDSMKNHILELYGIPLLRFQTNGSGEKEQLTAMLCKIAGN